ncbi:alpha-1,2-fucosyltransferase [Mucilaginibacter sp. OK098]|uniref:alpha-1,2-fucosyltransferase n=1 Tax=Mucilaginibacter sp. OK098 TaxID=1855297 RepID=UPI00091CEBE8|nr:alpha-1,2-fucosyltransferase [Mucilaginibacter sp. OK098]SHN24128.1 Glycosyl transferase family 11 [Mucilaginibacter sp. OK098]
MIAVRLQGRLGNQMFQYAFILAASKQLNTNFYIDQYIELSSVERYFNNIVARPNKALTQLFKIKGFKNIFSFHLRRAYYKYLAKVNKLAVYEYDYNGTAAEITLQNNILYFGFYQSESFFDSIKETIKNGFTIKNVFIEAFNLKYSSLYQHKKIVTVHIRRTDYQSLEHLNLGAGDLSLPKAYYEKALAKFEGQNVHFVFISDDRDFVNQNFKEVNNKTISADSEIMDFQHLLNADACIISNSTFSWWGAWLNNKPGKTIYAPRYFLGWRIKLETPREIYPGNWTLIDF